MSLIAALFDVRFDRLISRQLLGLVYGIALGLHLLTGVVLTIAFLASGAVWMVMLGAVVVPAVTVLGALGLRVLFEAAAVFFRGAEDLRAVRDGALSQSPTH